MTLSRTDRLAAASFGAVAVAVGLALAAADLAGLRYNATPSVPVGLYREVDRGPGRGVLVFFCLDEARGRFARERGYVSAGRECPGGTKPLLKPVAAIPGDHVQVASDGVTINGRPAPNSAPRARDSRGRPLAAAEGGVVPAGNVWILSGHTPASYDSRYFGPVPVDQIVAAAVPVAVRD